MKNIFKGNIDSILSQSMLTVPADRATMESLNDLPTLIKRVTYIACKKHPTIQRPDFFTKGVTKHVMTDLKIKIKNCYETEYIDQAIALDLTLPQLKKFYAIINTTDEVFLPEIDEQMLLPYFIKKILLGKLSKSEIAEIGPNNAYFDFNACATSKGHSWLNKQELVDSLLHVGYIEKAINHWLEMFAIEKDGMLIYKEHFLEDNKLAANIKELQKNETDQFLSVSLIDLEEIDSYYSQDQREAIKGIAVDQVSFLRGGAGTGKTSTVDANIEKMKIDKADVLALAPTHKAKTRMRDTPMANYGREIVTEGGRKYNFSGPQTVHSVGYQCLRNDFCTGFKVLIVDEAGMIGSEHSKLLNAIIEKLNIEKIIFVGDPEQLSPVGLGSLIDILEYCNVRTHRLTTCHRSVKSIYNLCENILSDTHISKKHLDLHEIPVDSIHNANGFHQLFTPEYKEILLKHWDINAKDQFVSVAYTNKAVNRLNVLTQIFLINAGLVQAPKDLEAHKDLARTVYTNGTKNIDLILVGDVIISSVNADGMTNGSRGEVLAISTNQWGQKSANIKLFEKDINGKRIEVSSIKLDGLSLAYGCTIHKMQGDEAKHIVYIWSNIDTRSLAYTACSRPKENLFIFVPASDKAYIPLNNNVERITTFKL